MPYSRGDVVLVLYPDSNLRTAKRRPAIVVQRDNLQSGLAQVIVAMISSNRPATDMQAGFTSCARHLKDSRWEYGPTRLW